MPLPQAAGGAPNPDVAHQVLEYRQVSPWTELGRGKEAGVGLCRKMQARGTTWKGVMWRLCGFPSMWWPHEQSPQAGWPASHAWPTGEAGGMDGGGLVQLPQAARLHLGRHS